MKEEKQFVGIFKNLVSKGIKIYIITRDPNEHDDFMNSQAEEIIQIFERIGVQVLINSGNDHRKLAIIDRSILFEGSLNILSQNQSKEIMRRINDNKLSMEMFNFLNLGKIL